MNGYSFEVINYYTENKPIKHLLQSLFYIVTLSNVNPELSDKVEI